MQLKLDAEYPTFTHNLLEIAYPHYLAPTPSMTVVQLQTDPDEGSLAGPSLVRMRQLLQEVVATRVAAGDAAIRYLDGLSLFGAADAHMLPDDLHPNTEGYRLMGERFNALMLSGDQPLIRA